MQQYSVNLLRNEESFLNMVDNIKEPKTEIVEAETGYVEKKLSNEEKIKKMFESITIEEFFGIQQALDSYKKVFDDFQKGFHKAEIHFSETAWYKILYLVAECSDEVAWDGFVKRRDGEFGVFDVLDIIVYPQKVTGATVTTDDEEYINWLNSLNDEEFATRRFNGHSHVNMGVTPSGVDMTYRDQSLKNVKDFFIFAIFNKKTEVNIEIYDVENNIYYKNEDIVYFTPEPDYTEWAKEQLKEHVTKKYYGAYGAYGNTYGTRSSNTGTSYSAYGNANNANSVADKKKDPLNEKKEEKKNTQSLEDYEKACEEYYDRTYGKSWRTAMGYLD